MAPAIKVQQELAIDSRKGDFMHDRVSVNSIGLLNFSLTEQAQCWRSLGARRVSLYGPQLDNEGFAAAERALGSGDFTLETIIHHCLPEQYLDGTGGEWEEARARLNTRIEMARQLGARSVYMTTGGPGAFTWEKAASAFAEAVAPCTARARSDGIALMVENTPQLYADQNIAHNLRDAVALAERADVGVCIDLFSCWSEADLENTIKRAMPRCALVQVSDYVCGDRALPCRAVPGDGDIPLTRLLDWVLSAGYQGSIELELLGPRIDREGPLEATRRAADAVGELLVSLGA